MNIDNDQSNEHLRTYISYYKSLNNPKYAVLVKGEWGVGKTHLINSILKNDEKFYVSLFGLTTIQEVHTAVFIKMYPTRSWIRKVFNWFGNSSMKANELTLTFGPLIGNIANALIKEKVDNTKPIIFDDLERCSIKHEDLFGAINKYIEHHGCKVIVIAHDEKLNEELTDKKEKIFGQVVKVSPDIEGAFNHFIKLSKIPTAFDIIREIVYKSFIASGCKSLRVLDYVINDCARLLACLSAQYIKNERLLTELFTTFTAFNINYRLGKLKEIDFDSRNAIYFYAKKEGDAINTFNEIKKSYKDNNDIFLNIESDLLTNEVLVNTIVNGIYDKKEILNSIDCSRYFIRAESKGPWFTIINFDSLKTCEVDNALAEMYSKFDRLEITEKGEILHSINLLFMLSEANHIQKSFDDVFSMFLDYVRRLQQNNKFPPADLFTDFEPIRDSAYGYGFWINDSYKHYSSKLNAILKKQERISLKKQYPSILAELKKCLIEDTPKFCNLISRNGFREANKYGYIDILSSFKPHEFVDTWLNIEMTDWHMVRSALVNRYSGGSLQGDLEEEGPWLKNIKMNLRHRASNASGIDKLRISRLMINL